ncbi:MAG: hypothetical protein LBE13_01775 [Bacteroidales bacterium]|jgi:hypothetical protein|nr:hypothetical protein [Bacteroidales bacterium]
MQKNNAGKSNTLGFKAIYFVVTAGLGWSITVGIMLLGVRFGYSAFISNAVGDTCGITFTYFVATKKIFFNNGKFLVLKLAIYIVYSVLIVLFISMLMEKLVNCILLQRFSELILIKVEILAKLTTTPISLSITFFFLKYLLENFLTSPLVDE